MRSRRRNGVSTGRGAAVHILTVVATQPIWMGRGARQSSGHAACSSPSRVKSERFASSLLLAFSLCGCAPWPSETAVAAECVEGDACPVPPEVPELAASVGIDLGITNLGPFLGTLVAEDVIETHSHLRLGSGFVDAPRIDLWSASGQLVRSLPKGSMQLVEGDCCSSFDGKVRGEGYSRWRIVVEQPIDWGSVGMHPVAMGEALPLGATVRYARWARRSETGWPEPRGGIALGDAVVIEVRPMRSSTGEDGESWTVACLGPEAEPAQGGDSGGGLFQGGLLVGHVLGIGDPSVCSGGSVFRVRVE